MPKRCSKVDSLNKVVCKGIDVPLNIFLVEPKGEEPICKTFQPAFGCVVEGAVVSLCVKYKGIFKVLYESACAFPGDDRQGKSVAVRVLLYLERKGHTQTQ